jgi:hypothetical protein
MRRVVVPVVVAAAVAAGATPASACSCTGVRSPKEELAVAAVVFRGVVTEVTPAREWLLLARWLPGCSVQSLLSGRKLSECVDEGYRRDYWDAGSFRVQKVWKGPVRGEFTVLTPPGGGGFCGLSWRAGDEWVIYAEEGSSVLYAHTCMRSRSGAAVLQESRELDAEGPSQ